MENVKILGDIRISHNSLVNLIGSPKNSNGSFYCNDNKLTSLRGAPVNVNGNFDCSNNKLLTSLEYAPKTVGNEKILDELRINKIEKSFYKSIKTYNKYYKDLMLWMNAKGILKDNVDNINWPEEFLNSDGSLIRSLIGINKFNLGFSLDDT